MTHHLPCLKTLSLLQVRHSLNLSYWSPLARPQSYYFSWVLFMRFISSLLSVNWAYHCSFETTCLLILGWPAHSHPLRVWASSAWYCSELNVPMKTSSSEFRLFWSLNDQLQLGLCLALIVLPTSDRPIWLVSETIHVPQLVWSILQNSHLSLKRNHSADQSTKMVRIGLICTYYVNEGLSDHFLSFWGLLVKLWVTWQLLQMRGHSSNIVYNK